MWAEIRIHLPDDGPTYGDRARQFVARLDNEAGGQLNPAIYHYTSGNPEADAAATTRNGLSPIRFGAKKGLIRVFAVGEEAVDFLQGEGHKITRLLARSYRQPLREERFEGECRLEALPYLKDFWLRSIVFQRRHFDLYKEAALTSQTEASIIVDTVQQTITDGIVRQANLLLQDAPEFTLGDVTVGRLLPIHVKDHQWMLCATHVRFKAGLRFSGPWHVGHLCARGYGWICQSRGGRP